MAAADTLAKPAQKADPRLIVPLDVPSVEEARAMVTALGDTVSFYKVGLELFAGGEGMTLARELKAAGKQVFIDWKLHDIGTTVQRAASVLAGAGCDLLTVHAEPQVMASAVRGRGGSSLKILAVTVLTSLTDEDLIETGYHETARALGGKDFLVVTPGVRPDWSAKNDQARAATPLETLQAGASHIVCGRPITAANDPQAAARRVAGEMAGA